MALKASVGTLRERIRFTRTTKTRRADGGYDTTEATIFECWAAVRPVSARENEQSGRMAGRAMYAVTIRRTESLTTEDTLVWLSNGNMALNIKELALPSKRTEFMELKAEAGAVL